MVETNNGATRPASPVIPNDTYVKRVVSSTEIEAGQKATYSTKKLVGDRNGDARNLILTNKNFIAREAYDRMVLDFPGFTTPTGNSQDCIDDIVDVIEELLLRTLPMVVTMKYGMQHTYTSLEHMLLVKKLKLLRRLSMHATWQFRSCVMKMCSSMARMV